MRICVPVPSTPSGSTGVGGTPLRRLAGPLGVIDNAKPNFDVLARKILSELTSAGGIQDEALYVQKTTATRAADPPEIDRLASGAVAVIVGSGD